MKENNINQKHCQFFKVVCLVSIGTVVKYLLLIAVNIIVGIGIRKGSHVSPFILISFAINNVAYEMFNNVYLLSIYLLKLRLSNVVEFLKELGRNQQEPTSNNIEAKLKTCGELVDKICDIMESLKTCCSINTFNYILYFLLFATLSFYSIISLGLRKSSTNLDPTYTLMTTVWTISYLPYVVWIFMMSSEIKNKRNLVENCFQKILEKNSQNLKVFKRAELIFLQFEHRHPLNSCGYFVIDWHLSFQFMVMFSSYLIIIIQFELKLLVN